MDTGDGQKVMATIASVRELNTVVPSGFVNQHLDYTHGYGAVLAPISQRGVNADGTPKFTLSQLPPTGTPPSASPPGAQIYYGVGTDTGGYVIADSKNARARLRGSQDRQQVTTNYAGKGGVQAGVWSGGPRSPFASGIPTSSCRARSTRPRR